MAFDSAGRTARAPFALVQTSAPVVLKFSHVVAPDSPKGKGSERFRQLAEERSKGRLTARRTRTAISARVHRDQVVYLQTH